MEKTKKEFEFIEKHKFKMSQPIIRNFLMEESNYNLFQKVVNKGDNESKTQLNKSFQRYYKNAKIIGYIAKLIHFQKRRNSCRTPYSPFSGDVQKHPIRINIFNHKLITPLLTSV